MPPTGPCRGQGDSYRPRRRRQDSPSPPPRSPGGSISPTTRRTRVSKNVKAKQKANTKRRKDEAVTNEADAQLKREEAEAAKKKKNGGTAKKTALPAVERPKAKNAKKVVTVEYSDEDDDPPKKPGPKRKGSVMGMFQPSAEEIEAFTNGSRPGTPRAPTAGGKKVAEPGKDEYPEFDPRDRANVYCNQIDELVDDIRGDEAYGKFEALDAAIEHLEAARKKLIDIEDKYQQIEETGEPQKEGMPPTTPSKGKGKRKARDDDEDDAPASPPKRRSPRLN